MKKTLIFQLSFYLLCLCSMSVLAKENISFTPYGVRDGLSQNTVYASHQDKYGFMWFATQDGLNRFDGYQFKTFRADNNDNSSIDDAYVLKIYKDRKGFLWFGANNGTLSRYDDETESFINYPHKLPSKGTPRIDAILQITEHIFWIGTVHGLFAFDIRTAEFTPLPFTSKFTKNDISILSLAQTPTGEILIGTYQNGLFIFEPSTNKFSQYSPHPQENLIVSRHTIFDILIDHNNEIFVGTTQGLLRFLPEQGQFEPVIKLASKTLLYITEIIEDEKNRLWLASSHGLYKMNKNRQQHTIYKHDSSKLDSLPGDIITSIFIAKDNLIWVGAGNNGVASYNTNNAIHQNKHSDIDDSSVASNAIWDIIEASDGSIWIANDQQGISIYNRQTNSHRHLKHSPNNNNSLSSNRINTILETSPGIFWIGTFDAGITVYNTNTQKYSHYRHNESDESSVTSNKIYKIFKDSANQVWIGTNNGLDLFSPSSNNFKHYKHEQHDKNTIAGNLVVSLFEDAQKQIWVGTLNNGVSVMDDSRQFFTHYKVNQSNPNSLSHNMVLAVNQDNDGNIWLATFNGLNKLSATNNKITRYSMDDGLPSNGLYSLIFTENNNLWLSSNNGISQMDTKNETFTNYSLEDGVAQQEYNFNSYLKTADGKLFYGGFDGYDHFYPDQLQKKDQPLTVNFTSLRVLNNPVNVEPYRTEQKYSIDKGIDHIQSLEFDHTITLFSVEFSALSFLSPKTVQYQYMLQGFDKSWINVDSNIRQAVFTSIPSGQYTLQVRAKLAQGQWNGDIVELPINILPAPWLSWWAYTLYILTIFLITFSYLYQRRLQFVALQNSEQKLSILNQELEQRVASRTSELSETLSDLKNTQHQLVESEKQASLVGVVSGVAHELNTPLGNILTATSNNQMVLSDLYKNMAEQTLTREKFTKTKELIESAINLTLDNTNKAIKLVQSFKALSTHELTTQNTTINIYSLLRQIEQQTLTLRSPLDIKFLIDCDEKINIFSAQDILEDIFTQLIENSTLHGFANQDKKSISILAFTDSTQITITYRDNGCGITNATPEQILEPFFTTKRGEQHTGLGLTVVFNKVTHRLQGNVVINDNYNDGFELSITLPLSITGSTK